MIDDLGWMDLACQGNPLVDTPHIDALAKQGLRFTSAYAAAPVCSPTRAAILTGQSPARLRITNHLPDQKQFAPKNAKLNSAECIDHLAADYETIAERVRDAGYTTAFMGKWHVAQRNNTALFPLKQGFDINIGGCSFGGPPTFFDPYRIPTIKNRKAGEYLPDRLADEAVGFFKRQKSRSQPFMLFLWNYTVHWPMEAPEHLLKKYSNRKGPGLNDTRYGAMIEAMDGAIGRVIEALDNLKFNNTLLIFTSDNGAFGGVGDNRPLRAEKGYLYEGGIRVPMIVRWPGTVAANTISDAPVISTDLYATIRDAAGIEPKEGESPDGQSLLPLLKSGTPPERDALYWHYPNYAFHKRNRLGSAIRAGRYKLIERFDDNSIELYDLEKDISEKTNLADKYPDTAADLKKKLHAWRVESNAAMPTPTESLTTQ
ncbi:UNVERIFIED_CONTAM: hypothetical protein GTU68_054787 [Idotea baltica]|nr:hypothetical protein [Idotea baltica]